jgi:AcrR family transcriptional regulator
VPTDTVHRAVTPESSGEALRAELSRERILDAAETLIDREGDGALTFRRLGAELGADPTAAYRYFRNKDDLLLALGDRLLGEAIAAGTDGLTDDADWRSAFGTMARALRTTLVRHPRLATLVSVRITQGEHEAYGIERGMAVLAGTGLSTRDIVGIQRAFADTVLAWCAYSASFLALPAEAKARDAAAWATTYAQLPTDEYPNIHAAQPYFDEFDDAFDLALELLLDGIAARINRSQETA